MLYFCDFIQVFVFTRNHHLKEIVFCWLPSHTNNRGNELADLEAKSALSLSITNLKIPHSDFKSNIHQYVMNKCQSVWEEQTENKLHELKPDFKSKCSFLGYSRQNQTKITRRRIGHTRLTHAYLLTNEQPPFCISRNEPCTVKHFLIIAQNLITSAINIIPQKLSNNFLMTHHLTKSSISLKKPTFLTSCSPVPPGGWGRNRWLLCACSRWVRPPLYNATVRYTVPLNSLKQYKNQ